MQNLNEFILNAADQCVKCGLCLPHCPTYTDKKHEGESPRGRIALLQGIACGELDATSAAKTYIDHCLSCFEKCETVCPANVNYGALFMAGKKLLAENK